jgi:hypothetical protein
MNRTFIISLFASICALGIVFAEPPPAVTPVATAKPGELKDPRSVMFPVILYHNQKDHRDGIQGALLIFARWDIKPPNQILGIDGSFTGEQIVTGLRKFYREWRPPAGDSTQPRPQLILAQQNWGCGSDLYEPLKALSAEFEIDIYQLYPVVTQIESNPGHPTPNDKRLGELIKGAQP